MLANLADVAIDSIFFVISLDFLNGLIGIVKIFKKISRRGKIIGFN